MSAETENWRRQFWIGSNIPIHDAGLLHGECALLDDDCGKKDGGSPHWSHARQRLQLLVLLLILPLSSLVDRKEASHGNTITVFQNEATITWASRVNRL